MDSLFQKRPAAQGEESDVPLSVVNAVSDCLGDRGLEHGFPAVVKAVALAVAGMHARKSGLRSGSCDADCIVLVGEQAFRCAFSFEVSDVVERPGV